MSFYRPYRIEYIEEHLHDVFQRLERQGILEINYYSYRNDTVLTLMRGYCAVSLYDVKPERYTELFKRKFAHFTRKYKLGHCAVRHILFPNNRSLVRFEAWLHNRGILSRRVEFGRDRGWSRLCLPKDADLSEYPIKVKEVDLIRPTF